MKLIAGIDPGTTTAVAIVDIDSDFYELFSSRRLAKDAIVKIIEQLGEPVAVASDVSKPPEKARKVAAAFSAMLYAPSEDMPVRKKRQMTRGFGYANKHERDALAAALAAKRSIRHRLQRAPDGAAIAALLKGRARNISEAASGAQ